MNTSIVSLIVAVTDFACLILLYYLDVVFLCSCSSSFGSMLSSPGVSHVQSALMCILVLFPSQSLLSHCLMSVLHVKFEFVFGLCFT